MNPIVLPASALRSVAGVSGPPVARKFLATGDAWFASGSKLSASLLTEAEFSEPTLIVNCATPGNALTHAIDALADPEFDRLLRVCEWDGVLLSVGGTDLVDAVQVPPVSADGGPIPEDRRLLRTAPEVPRSANDRSLHVWVSDAGWSRFHTYLVANIEGVLRRRDSGLNRSTPLFLHTYQVPTARPSGTPMAVNGWLHSSYLRYGIPPELHQPITEHLFRRLRDLLVTFDSERGGLKRRVHVIDLFRDGNLAAAKPDLSGVSGDWLTEIHPTRNGYRKLGRIFGRSIDMQTYVDATGDVSQPWSRQAAVHPHEEGHMDLQQFMDQYANQRRGSDLTAIGPASQRVFKKIGNEGVTRAIVANNYWRAFLASSAYQRALTLLQASAQAVTQARVVVVPRTTIHRFDLLVLDPGLQPGTPPRALAVTPGLFRPQDVQAGAHRAAQDGVPPAIGPDFLDLAKEAAFTDNQPFTVVLAPPPETERLYVPGTAVPVDDLASNISTAGVVVECRANPKSIGVTAALHGVLGSTTVKVDGQRGTVLRSDPVSDSAFIELAAQPSAAPVPTKGIMTGITPRHQPATFIGATSGHTNTKITGWDPQIPNPSPYRQALVYTARDAQPGDSGAALVTDDSWIVGFAFERTLPNQDPVQCSWVWAESVLNHLNVKLI